MNWTFDIFSIHCTQMIIPMLRDVFCFHSSVLSGICAETRFCLLFLARFPSTSPLRLLYVWPGLAPPNLEHACVIAMLASTPPTLGSSQTGSSNTHKKRASDQNRERVGQRMSDNNKEKTQWNKQGSLGQNGYFRLIYPDKN